MMDSKFNDQPNAGIDGEIVLGVLSKLQVRSATGIVLPKE
jgi:hypothetical protein